MPSLDTGKGLPLPATFSSSGRPLRRWVVLVGLIVLGFFGRKFYNSYKPIYIGGDIVDPPPPKYLKLRDYEQNLPQHNLSLPFPEGRNGRYVRFFNQIRGLGWNNVLNEM
jgi:hypothetical protein